MNDGDVKETPTGLYPGITSMAWTVAKEKGQLTDGWVPAARETSTLAVSMS